MTAITIIVVVVIPSSPFTIVTRVRWITHIDSWGWRMCALCDGKVHANPTSVNLHTRALFFCNFGIFFVLIVNEAKSSRTSSFCVKYHLHAFQISVFGENVTYLPFGSVNTQTEYSETSIRFRMFPIAGASFSTIHRTTGTATSTRVRSGSGF